MNIKMVRYIISMFLSAEGAFLLLPIGTALIYGEFSDIPSFLFTIAAIAVTALLLGIKKPENDKIFAKESFFSVSVGWILISLFGALPYFFSGSIPNYIDCIFETVSGFTTTGATILTEIESLPKCILFWRSFTHWIGGMGVIVFLLMLTQISEGHSLYIMRAEVPGPSVGKIAPKAKSNSIILYEIYAALTLLEMILLLFGGMPFFDAINTAMSTAGTGGFAIKNMSIAAYDSTYIEWVIAIFMLLFGVNFNIYFLLIFKKFKDVFYSEELRVFLGIVLASSLLIAININGIYGHFADSFREAVFQVAAIISTTGFYHEPFMEWPHFSKAIILFLMITGACAGSTAGGLKLSRVIISFKTIKNSANHLLHPHDVQTIKFEGKQVDGETRDFISVYICIFFTVIIGSTILLMAFNNDIETSLSAVISCFNNVGPGLGKVGDMGDYNVFNGFEKIYLSLLMLTGRLEIYPVILLFARKTWKN